MLNLTKVLILVLFPMVFVMTSLSQASDDKNNVVSEDAEIQACLRSWKNHPFGKKLPDYRTLKTNVKVFGIGGDTTDEAATKKPELVYIKTAVNVMGKDTLKLLNPNGWYCLQGKVTVMGKTEIQLHCKANLALSGDSATVLGASDANEGVSVMGANRIKRVGCVQ